MDAAEEVEVVDWDATAPSPRVAEYLKSLDEPPTFGDSYGEKMWDFVVDVWNQVVNEPDPEAELKKVIGALTDPPFEGFTQWDMDWSIAAISVMLGMSPEFLGGIRVLSSPTWDRSRFGGVLHSGEAAEIGQQGLELYEKTRLMLEQYDPEQPVTLTADELAIVVRTARQLHEVARFHAGVSQTNERHKMKMESALRALRPFALSFPSFAFGDNKDDNEMVLDLPNGLTRFHVRCARAQYVDLLASDDAERDHVRRNPSENGQ